MISPSPDRDQPAKPHPMTFTIPATPVKPRPMAAELLEELDQISSQAEAIAVAIRRLCLDPDLLEATEPGSAAIAQRSCCRLETAAEHIRGLCP